MPLSASEDGRKQPPGKEAPDSVYRRLLAAAEAQLVREQTRDKQLSYARLTVVVAAFVSAILLLHQPDLLLLLLIPLIVFIVLAMVHQRVLQRVSYRSRVVEFYRRGMARLENRWAESGETGDRFLDPVHSYARDLDLFGGGSLFQLLCTARTRAGEEALARWLLHPAAPEAVTARHESIFEIRGRLSFRERLFAAGESTRVGVHPEALTAWGEGPAALPIRWLAPLLLLLSLSWVTALIGWISVSVLRLTVNGWFTGGWWYLFLAFSFLNFSANYLLKTRVAHPLASAEAATADLALLAATLAAIEQESFTATRLRALRESLRTARTDPSAAVRRLQRLAEWIEARRNPVAAFLNHFVFYNAHLILAVDRWQRTFGSSIRGWLSTVGEFEALAALAGYAFEHPDDVLPEFTDDTPCFDAEGLAHPLLPAERAVCNDLRLDRSAQLIVISGPNMAGKSTFLRGVGLNAVLAQCGAPVRARRLRLSPLAVGASICVLDSLQGGVSRFYAEIKRLKALSDLAHGPVPLLFLLDELLSGTNSHDRLEGTRSIVQSLVRAGAVGLITTHDLALTAIPQSMNGAASNAHFEDAVEDGKLLFDYRLKAGVVRTSNALKLMQAIGLDVGDAVSE
jgi:hypothetical protein